MFTIIIIIILILSRILFGPYISDAVICAKALPSSQFNALHSLYNSTNGPYWCTGGSTKWNFTSSTSTSTPCTEKWVGVRCDCHNSGVLSTYAISELLLFELCMDGTIPSSISQLIYLTALDASGNLLHGTIPSSIGDMKYIDTMLLGVNNLTGSIPSSFGQMKSLTILTLDVNLLNGTIPDSFGQASKLEILNLKHNNLVGTIPKTLGNLKNLTDLYLSYNQLTGKLPIEMINAENLANIYLNNNLFMGTIPKEYASTNHLNLLLVNDNYLSGQVSTSFLTNSHMQSLYVAANLLTGPFLSNITIPNYSFQYLSIGTNLIYGTISSNISLLANLAVLEIDLTSISGTIPFSIGLLTNIQNLVSDRTLLHGAIPEQFYYLISLISISLSDNYLTSTISNSIGKLKYLNYLDISYNNLHGSLPLNITTLKYLKFIIINDNLLSGTIPPFSKSLSTVASFSIFNNVFTGTLPASVVNPSITVFSISNNYLSGTLPTSFDSLSLLQTFEIDSNHLSGTIPSKLGTSTEISFIWLFSNYFTGSIPSFICHGILLSEILINDNSFSGSFFDKLNTSALTSLQVINVADNILTGSLPADFFEFGRITGISLVNNCFTGKIPISLCNNSYNNDLALIDFDGMGSNPSCESNAKLYNELPSFVTGTFDSLGLSGTIPECIFNIPSLTSLHLSGNNLIGTLPELPNESILSDLRLSNNGLTGTIPYSIQYHEFTTGLDLSYNRLHGTLVDDFVVSSTQTILGLAVNRLSGPLPYTLEGISGPSGNDSNTNSDDNTTTISEYSSSSSSSSQVYSLTTLNILVGNIFSCNNQDIPSLDTYSQSYSCGSFELNISSYIWIGLTTFIIIVLFIVYLITQKMKIFFKQFKTESSSMKMIGNLLRLIQSWRTLTTQLMERKIEGSFLETKSFIITMNIIRWFTTLVGIILIFVLIPSYISLSLVNPSYSIVADSYAYILTMAFLHGITPVVFISICVLTIIWFLSFNLQIIRRLMFQYHPITATSPSKLEQNQQSLAKFTLQKYSILILLHCINIAVTTAVNASYVGAIISNQSISSTNLLVIQGFVGLFKLVWNSAYCYNYCSRWFTKYMSVPRSMQNRLVMALTNFIFAPCIATMIANQSCFYYAFEPYPEVTSSSTFQICIFYAVCNSSNMPCCLLYSNLNFSTDISPHFKYTYECGTALVQSYIPVLLYTYIISGLVLPILRLSVALYIGMRRSQMTTFSTILRVRGRETTVMALLHLTVLLTFGIAAPILGIPIVVSMIVDYYLSRLLLGQYFPIPSVNVFKVSNSQSNLNEYDVKQLNMMSDNTISSSMISNLTILENEDMKDSWRGLFACFGLILVTVSFYWVLLFVDMIADNYSLIYVIVTTASFMGFSAISSILILYSDAIVNRVRQFIHFPREDFVTQSTVSTYAIYLSFFFEFDSLQPNPMSSSSNLVEPSNIIYHDNKSEENNHNSNDSIRIKDFSQSVIEKSIEMKQHISFGTEAINILHETKIASHNDKDKDSDNNDDNNDDNYDDN